MTNMGFTYMVLAYFAVWIVLFGYLLFIGLRVMQIQKDIQYLTEVVKKRSK
jgi:CcmD family protein